MKKLLLWFVAALVAGFAVVGNAIAEDTRQVVVLNVDLADIETASSLTSSLKRAFEQNLAATAKHGNLIIKFVDADGHGDGKKLVTRETSQRIHSAAAPDGAALFADAVATMASADVGYIPSDRRYPSVINSVVMADEPIRYRNLDASRFSISVFRSIAPDSTFSFYTPNGNRHAASYDTTQLGVYAADGCWSVEMHRIAVADVEGTAVAVNRGKRKESSYSEEVGSIRTDMAFVEFDPLYIGEMRDLSIQSATRTFWEKRISPFKEEALTQRLDTSDLTVRHRGFKGAVDLFRKERARLNVRTTTCIEYHDPDKSDATYRLMAMALDDFESRLLSAGSLFQAGYNIGNSLGEDAGAFTGTRRKSMKFDINRKQRNHGWIPMLQNLFERELPDTQIDPDQTDDVLEIQVDPERAGDVYTGKKTKPDRPSPGLIFETDIETLHTSQEISDHQPL